MCIGPHSCARHRPSRYVDVCVVQAGSLGTFLLTLATTPAAPQTQLDELNREFAAIDAYEAAKSGKAPAAARQPRGARARPQARRVSKREALMQVIKDNPSGLTRGESLDRMGLKGNKSGEMSVSNALTALTKANQVTRRDGRYVAA